ncbi:MAG: coproporphyrinogen dehydrogenase HemZ [Oscillospiraceae bacterium]|nr:coproporphyrinogen dehydrogenase HemZ [Oscillospiraceae bacterium]
MQLILSGHSYRYECENLCRLFFPYSPVRVGEAEPEIRAEEPCAFAGIERKGGQYHYTAKVSDGKNTVESSCEREVMEEYSMTNLLYRAFVELTGYQPAWGMLTGIHPVKLLRQYCGELGEERGTEKFRTRCHVSAGKTELALRTLRAQSAAVEALEENDFNLYVSIPFCPTRCAYCSFVSQSVEQAKKLIAPYFELLLLEIEKTAAVTRALGLTLSTVYIGGGTPTTLSAAQLAVLCEKIREQFDFSRCDEFTVEAGRPDTITREKLEALKAGGVTRISINPQSLSDRVLQNIGRKHTAKDVTDAFALADSLAIREINADLIVGLPGDDLLSFQRTLQGVISLGASNITVHSLALKRSARLVSEGGDLSLHRKGEETAAMMDYSISRLTKEGYEPYYLYRQTRMAGNLENTGWAKPGSICRYNIYTMDESSSVIACGAGGVSKLKDPYSDRLERIFNFKYPYEYIARNSEILQRKDGVTALYEQFRQRIH